MGAPQAAPRGWARLPLLAALAALLPAARAQCSYDLALPADGGLPAASGAGFCPPFSSLGGAVLVGATAASCTGILVPGGALLSYGTCALPGAACTGATALRLYDASGDLLSSIGRVALNSSVAALEQGCVLGARCSYGEWRNPALEAAVLTVAEGCYGHSACAGVVAWRVGATPALLPASTSSTTSVLAFTVTAASAATLTALAGAGAGASVTVWSLPGDAFAAGALGSSAGWARKGSASSWSGGAVSLSSPVALAAGATASFVVVVTGSGASNALSCAHGAGTPGVSALLADGVLSVTQAAALPSAWSGPGDGTACAWQGLTLSYDVAAACAVAAPPPPNVVTSVPNTLVGSLDDLLRALANSDVTQIQVNAHIALNGTELAIALDPVSNTRTLRLLGTNACRSANPATPLCSIRSVGSGRVLRFGNGVTLRIGYLLLADGVAPAGNYGGCVFAQCADCSLTLDNAEFRNCSAPGGSGGGVAELGGGSLVVTSSLFTGNTAAEGAGLLASDGLVTLNATRFVGNTATGDSRQPAVTLAGLPGPSGGGAAVFNASGTISGCVFDSNAAVTNDMLLTYNPALPQARGGGLFVALSTFNVSACTFSSNTAYYGGGAYAHNSTLVLTQCALTDNVASVGDGGGLFAKDSPCVDVIDSLVARNAAGGHTGGGLAAINTPFELVRSVLADNSCPDGCGGGAGMDTGAALVISDSSVISGNDARSGGGVCCNLCANMSVEDTQLYGNTAEDGPGGAVYAGLSPTTMSNASLWANRAPSGGGIAAVSSPLVLTDCALTNNTGWQTHGGAVLHDARDDGAQTLVMTRCAFDNNTCAAAGGAVAAFSSASALVDFCTFNFNEIESATPAGGAVMALDVVSLTVSNSSFIHNSVRLAPALAEDALLGFVDEVAALGMGRGGGIWVGSNVPTDTLVTGSFFQRNSGPDAGAMYLTGSARMTIRWSDYYHDHSVGELTPDGLVTDGVGGGFATDMTSYLEAYDSYFFSCEAVRGGNSWHGGHSVAVYDRCWFEESESVPGDDTKGSTIYVGESANVTVSNSVFFNNMGHGIAEGTIAFGGTNESLLHVENTLFDSNFAYLGSSLFVTVPNQTAQLSLSGVTFSNNYAYVGGVMFTESAGWQGLACSPTPCDYGTNNTARNYGNVTAGPPDRFVITMPERVRSGAPLPVSVSLLDLFGQQVTDWEDTVGTIQTQALLTGTPRTFYQGGAAHFTTLLIRGNASAQYELEFTLTGPDLFGNDINTRSSLRNITIQACEAEETFDNARLECKCAVGSGLVLEDNSCRRCTANEIVPVGSLSCAACPDLSTPAGDNGLMDGCECIAGHFGTIIGATGNCIECPEDTYRALGDPPEQCRPCPETSYTFKIGATSAADCTCAANTFNDNSGVNGSFHCAPVPRGGWAPEGESRLYTLQSYWRSGPNATEFFACSRGFCLREEAATLTAQGSANATANASTAVAVAPQHQQQLGYQCRPGHTGHLCAVCEHGWAYQGVYCENCADGLRFEEWTPAKQGGLLFIGLFIACFLGYTLFFLPLSPRLEAAFQSFMLPAVERFEAALGSVANAVRPRSSRSGSRPNSAAHRPTSAPRLMQTLAQRTRALGAGLGLGQQTRALGLVAQRTRPLHLMTAVVPAHASDAAASDAGGGVVTRGPSALTRTYSGMTRRSSVRMGIAAADTGDGRTSSVHVRVERPSRARVFLDMIGDPIRIVFSFWQVVSSFSSNLYVPWPSIYYNLANRLSVVSLQFLKLPTLACVQPEVSFYIIFNGVTICTFIFVLFCLCVYFFGQRTEIARRDADRCARFKTQVLNCLIWGLFLVYPQVSSTTLLMFACTPLEGGTEWLMADYRIQCWTPRHKLHVGIAAMWTIAFPFGIPIAFLIMLWRTRVPELAAWKRDCAWLRSIVQRALIIGVPMPFNFDPDTITTESITIEHLQVLHKVFVENQMPDDDSTKGGLKPAAEPVRTATNGTERSNGALVGESARSVALALLPAAWADAAKAAEAKPAGDGDVASSAPGGDGAAAKTRRLGRRDSALRLAEPAVTRLKSLLATARTRVAAVKLKQTTRASTMRRTLSAFMWRDEREHYLAQLLLWAKHDKATLVAEPRDNQLRWRTYYEWRALRASGVHLGARDTSEQAAFFKFRFLFAGYSVHAWYWESIDLFHKLFLTSLISFIAPRTVVQVIVGVMFAFGMLLFTIHVRPYRERANNQLVALSMCNIFLFLFTGLLMQTDPEGISNNKLAFSVIVGGLTTSIVVFTFFLFLRELWHQLLNALFEIQDEEDEAAEAEELAQDMEHDVAEAGALGRHSSDGGESVQMAWDDGSAEAGAPPNGGEKHWQQDSPRSGAADDVAAAGEDEEGAAEAEAEEGPQQAQAGRQTQQAHEATTPPAPSWVSRLASPADKPRE